MQMLPVGFNSRFISIIPTAMQIRHAIIDGAVNVPDRRPTAIQCGMFGFDQSVPGDLQIVQSPNARLISFVHVGRATGANEKRQVPGAENLCQMPPDNISAGAEPRFGRKFRKLVLASLSEINQCSTSNFPVIVTSPHFSLLFILLGKQPRHPPPCILGGKRQLERRTGRC